MHTTKDGRNWEPKYLASIDVKTCIGCGRCFKVCGQSVLTLMGVNDEGELVSLDDDDDVERKVMAVVDGGACVGCGACARVCPANCQVHSAA